jgi:acyl-homoserine lactone acylase PvdQ
VRFVAAGAVLVALALPTSAAAVPDYASTALNIIPSGQYGAVPAPPPADDQARMYDALTPLFDNVRRRHLRRYFKSEALGIGSDGPARRERVPRRGVRLLRDRFNVPHIRGRTDDDVTWAAGWVLAEDRELLIERARYNARVDAVEVPGLDAIALIVGLQSFRPSRRTDREVAKQIGLLRRTRRGRRLLHDIDVFVRGINAYYRANDRDHEPWTRIDVIALNAIKSQLFGEGGGDEVRKSMFLDALQRDLGARRGFSVWNDLREVDDPESPVSIKGRFPYITPPRSRPGNVVVDDGSFEPVEIGERAAASLAMHPPEASNVLMVAGRRSASGRPLFVGGPQIGYLYPGLTLEMDLRGPGWHARGATTAPFPGYILIGRREDFVWTLTSAGADIIDTYVETLCGGSDLRYRYKGRCRRMTPFYAGTLGGERISFHRTVHGPVVGYATVDGRRVAITRKRSSYLRDATDQLLFQRLTRGRVRSAREFMRAASVSPQTFNTFYADNDETAMITTGRLPIRPRGVDAGLPTDGRWRYEWRGFARFRAHPRGIVRSGVLNNWNNQPARGFGPADNQQNYGAIHRVDLLNRNVARRRRHTLATLTGAMNAAATQDHLTVAFLPVLSAVLRGSPAPSPLSQRMLELLQDWRRDGASWLDRDLDGRVDHPGAAVLVGAWDRLADAAFRPVLNDALRDQLAGTFMSRYSFPPGGMSSGWHVYMHKDLRTLLGRRVRGRYANRYCGAGVLARCRAELWAAMEAAAAELAAAQGANPDAWRAEATEQRITFLPGLLPYTMRYTNRPSGIQQVISFSGHR